MEKFSIKLLKRFGAGAIIIGLLLVLSAFSSDVVSIAKTEYLIAIGAGGVIIGSILVLKHRVSRKTCRTGAVLSILLSIVSAGLIILIDYFDYLLSSLITFLIFILMGSILSAVIFIAVLSINKIGENGGNKRDPSPAG